MNFEEGGIEVFPFVVILVASLPARQSFVSFFFFFFFNFFFSSASSSLYHITPLVTKLYALSVLFPLSLCMYSTIYLHTGRSLLRPVLAFWSG